MKKYCFVICVLSLIFLGGCASESKIDPRVCRVGNKVLLTYGAYDPSGGGSLNRFSVMLADKELVKADVRFQLRGNYNGYIAALIPQIFGDEAMGIVFRDGSVFTVKDAEFESLTPVYESKSGFEVLSAARVGDKILGFASYDNADFKFYELREGDWVECDISSPLVSIAKPGIAEIVEYDSEPAIFWCEIVGRRLQGRIRAAVYTGDSWSYLPDSGVVLPSSSGYAVCRSKDGIILLQDVGGSSNAGSGMPLLEYVTASGWRSIADVPFSRESMALSGYGIDIKYVDDRYVVARADQSGIQVLYALNLEDGVWSSVEQFEEEEKGLLDTINTDLTMNYVLIALSVILLVILVRRRRRVRAAIAAENGEEADLPKDARFARLIKEARLQRIGGFASVLDRGFALFIDGFFVMPVPYFYLNAQDLDFVDLVFSAQELILFFVWLISLSIYMLIAELLFGQTIGKAITRLRVRSASGGKATPYQIILRNTARIIDFFPVPLGTMRIWYLIAAVCASVTPRRQRLGDILGKTVVRRYTPINKRKIILASASPRRSELLTEYGLNFDVIPADVDENIIPDMPPREFARLLAVRKANEVAARMANGELVIAADTVVALGERILGKPLDDTEARSMLADMSGRMHEVLTGVCIIDTATKQLIVSVERTEVEFREIPEHEISSYVESGEGRDKAGSYAIQGVGGYFVKATLGSTSNVIGMPMELFKKMLADLDAS